MAEEWSSDNDDWLETMNMPGNDQGTLKESSDQNRVAKLQPNTAVSDDDTCNTSGHSAIQPATSETIEPATDQHLDSKNYHSEYDTVKIATNNLNTSLKNEQTDINSNRNGNICIDKQTEILVTSETETLSENYQSETPGTSETTALPRDVQLEILETASQGNDQSEIPVTTETTTLTREVQPEIPVIVEIAASQLDQQTKILMTGEKTTTQGYDLSLISVTSEKTVSSLKMVTGETTVEYGNDKTKIPVTSIPTASEEDNYTEIPITGEKIALPGNDQTEVTSTDKITLLHVNDATESDTEMLVSEDDIPLSRYMHQLKVKENKNKDLNSESEIDSEDSFRLTKDDFNSSDSNLSPAPLDTDETDSDTTLEEILRKISQTKSKSKFKLCNKNLQKNKKRKEVSNNDAILSKKIKTSTSTDKRKKKSKNKSLQSTNKSGENDNPEPSNAYSNDIEIELVKDITKQDFILFETEMTKCEKKLDNLLAANGLKRIGVNADGNCFFEAASLHLSNVYSAKHLRQILCDHTLDNGQEYIKFCSTDVVNESYEEDILWIDFHTEVEELRGDGKWTNNAADFLPLVLSNWSGKTVRIFSSLSQTPIMDVTPTTSPHDDTEPILLAYITSETSDVLFSHYDGCVKLQKQNTDSKSGKQNVIEISEIDTREKTKMDASLHQKQKGTPTKTSKKVGRPTGTPKKRCHNFITPPKKKLFRKRKATPEEWKKNIRKKLCMTGKRYISQRGKEVPERSMKPSDCEKCKFKCNQNFSEKQREDIFNTFWSLESYTRKKDYVIARIEEKGTRKYIEPDVENKPAKRKRDVHRSYYLDIEDRKVAVCKNFFKKTLDVGDAYVDNAMKNQSGGVFVGKDKRGKQIPHNKTSNERLQEVRNHIESFPAVEGHYTRKSSNRKYLGAELNIPKMYDLYLEQYKHILSEKQLVSLGIYRKVFNEEYNYSFHIPKKDQCAVCVSYNKAVLDEKITEEQQRQYDEHQERKIRAREEKKKDKEYAKTSTDTFVATFDLQAVLQTPCSLVSQIYYMRKLNSYNLSIYNLATQNATCYLWSEINAKRGACEIATCLYLQLLSLPSTIKHAIFFSDACSGQNRNQFTATSLMHAVTNLPSIDIIDHKFLESGHTQMECDSMHSAIEFAKTKTEIFVPSEWATIIRMARRRNPYSVVPLQHEDIYDFKEVQKSTLKYNKVDSSGEKINWLKIKWLRFEKKLTDHIKFKYSFDEDFRKMRVMEPNKRGTPSKSLKINLPKKYKVQQQISSAKKKDLLSLCKTGTIPAIYHEFYKSLQSSSKVSDSLPDPDVNEEDQDSDNE